MRTIILAFCWMMMPVLLSSQAVITNIFDGPLSGGTPKGVEVFITMDVEDPTTLGLSSANNGTGATGSPEFVLPDGPALLAGSYIYFSSEDSGFESFFGFSPDYVTDAMLINGNDAIELFHGGQVIDVFGDVNVDGVGSNWEYTDGWASRMQGTGPDGENFMEESWIFSGLNALDGELTNASAANPVPLRTYALPSPDVMINVSGLSFTPQKILIDLNHTVQWENTEGFHNVNGSLATFPDNPEGFLSGPAASDPWTFLHTFTKAGVYNYQCDPHASLGMSGVVAVRPIADYYVNVENNFFQPQDLTIIQGETIAWINLSGFHNVNGSLASYPDNPEGFLSGVAGFDWIFSHTFNVPGVYDYHCDPHLDLDMTGRITVESKYPAISMAELHQNDADGISLFDEEFVQVEGVVYGLNLRTGGLLFSLIDETNRGIFIFLDSGDLGYTVSEGDQLIVQGQINQFNGLVQMVADQIELVSSGSPLLDPATVMLPDEESEGSFIRIENLSLVNASEWPASGTSANVRALSGSDTVLIRIDDDVEAGPAPSAVFNLTGVSGQFDSNSPYDEGYQILPRRAEDVDPVTPVTNLFDLGSVQMFPNPASSFLYIRSEEMMTSVVIRNLSGQLVKIISEETDQLRIPVHELLPGEYFVYLHTASGVGTAHFTRL